MSLEEDSILIIDAAFGKINDKLSTIYQNETNRQKYARRWIWELVQNARDRQKEGVNISVHLDENKGVVSFSHDGKCFNRLSLLRLITQISDKLEGEDNTGRFGTGFITTNLISKVIYIEGPYAKGNGDRTQFRFVLDRSAWQNDIKSSEFVHELKQQIKEAIICLDSIECFPIVPVTDEMTCFSYPIGDSGTLSNVKIGFEDIIKQLPLVMAFNPSIASVKINSDNYICRRSTLERLSPTIELSCFQIIKNEKIYKSIFVFTQVQTKSQIAIYATDKQLEKYPEQTPRLFCRFPMVGTECFGLPIVFNSELFEVTETRDALIDDHPQNLQLLDIALELYQFAMNYFIQQGNEGYQNICKMERYGMQPMNKPYADRAKQFYSDKLIVKTFHGEMKSLKSVRIPFIKPEEFPKEMPHQTKDSLSQLFYDLMKNCPNIEIPVYCDCGEWCHIYSETRISVEEIGMMIYSQNILSKMQQTWLSWLNQYIELLVLLNKKEYLRENAIYVSQAMNVISPKGNYKDNIQNEKLKEIYNLVFYPEKKDSIEKRLILKDLNLDHQIFTDILVCEDDKTLSIKIAQKVAEQQASAKNSGKLDSATQKGFYELFYWMNANEKIAAILFPVTFNDRMSLCSPSEQIENYNFGVQTKQELAKHGASSVDDLVQKIENRYSTYADMYLSELQNETIGILTNKPEEIDESAIIHLLQKNAIENEQELIWLLHASNYSAETIQSFLQYRRSSLDRAYELVKAMLLTAAERIFEHLRSKSKIYDLSMAKKIAPTVYDGILKNGQEICIIARPSNNNKVILYYDSEPNYLRKNYELWIVDTNNIVESPRLLTFGDMIKITGIRVIPLRNLFD